MGAQQIEGDDRGVLKCSGMSLERRVESADVFDDLDELVHAVALPASELDELFRTLDDEAAFWRPCNRDSTPASELE